MGSAQHRFIRKPTQQVNSQICLVETGTSSVAMTTNFLSSHVHLVTHLCFGTAADQLAEFLTFISSSSHVNVVNTLCSYRSYTNKLFTVLFGCDPLTDDARVKSVIDGFGKDHPSQPRWAEDET